MVAMMGQEQLKPDICVTCKHWEPEEWVRKSIADPDIDNEDYHEGKCQVLHDTLTIEENASTGYGSEGPHGIETVETPWDFGCNKWKAKPPDEKTT